MRRLLKLHSHSQSPAVTQIEVEITRIGAYGLMLDYVITGNIRQLCIPPVKVSERRDDLWRHTCFEVFIRESGAGYCEFNFAPSTEWSAYRFSDYRTGKRLADVTWPSIDVQATSERYALRAGLQLESLSDLLGHTCWYVGLSAVIGDETGHISYWALAHPSGKPDFHDAVSFACELPPMVRA